MSLKFFCDLTKLYHNIYFLALHKLNKEVYELSRKWYEQLPKEQKDKISESFGISQIPAMDDNNEYCGIKA
jgi:hypothetical protein